jgi:hypothetical protein
VVAGAPLLEAGGDAFGGAGIGIAGSADLDGSSSREKELDSVLRGGDAAESNDGNGDGLRGFPDHADGDRFDSGAGEAAGDVPQARAPRFHIDDKREEGVDEGDGVGTGLLGGLGHGGNGGDIGRQLHNEGTLGAGFGARDQIEEQVHIGAEGDAAVAGVGAGGIEFVGGDAFRLVEAIDDGEIVVDFVAEDIDDDPAAWVSAQGRQLLREELFDADVLEPDGVDHAGGGFYEARGLVAGHGLARDAFSDKATDFPEVDDLLEFNAVTKGAAGGNDRVDQVEAAEANAHVRLHCVSPPATHGVRGTGYRLQASFVASARGDLFRPGSSAVQRSGSEAALRMTTRSALMGAGLRPRAWFGRGVARACGERAEAEAASGR